MSKSDRIYKIFMSTMVVVIAGLLLATGIIAIQKQMRMKVSFSATPSIELQIDMKTMGADDSTYTKIFNNKESAYIGAGLSLSGNTLYFTEDFAKSYSGEIGASFTLRITNLNDFGLKVTSSGENATSNPLALKLQAGGQGTMDVSGVAAMSTLQLSFVEYNAYTVATSPQSGNFTFSGEAEAVKGEDYTANVKAHDGYTLTISITNDGGTTILTQDKHYTWDSSTGALRIYSAAVTGNITISCSTSANSYTVTLDNQSATTAGTTSVSATYGSAMPSITLPTKTGYTFGGYYTSTNGDGTQYYTSTGASAKNYDQASTLTLYAKWTVKTYTITYNLTKCSKTSGATSVNYGTSYSATITPNTNYYLTSGNFTATGIDSTGYTYNSTTGVFTITDWTKVTGNITITVTATSTPYSITYSTFAKDASTNYVYKMTMGSYSNINVTWIIAAGTTLGTFSESYNTTNTMMFTSKNYATTKTSGKFSYVDGNFYIGTTKVTKVFLISEYALPSAQFNTSTSYCNNFFALYENGAWSSTNKSNIYNHLHNTLMPQILGSSLASSTTYISSTSIPKTQVNTGSSSSTKSSVSGSARFFLLGGDTSESNQQKDSFAISDYFGTVTSANEPYKQVYTIKYKNAAPWHLRSGWNGSGSYMICVEQGGCVSGHSVRASYGVRPCFVLNLA